jgi:hypothetical protein
VDYRHPDLQGRIVGLNDFVAGGGQTAESHQ